VLYPVNTAVDNCHLSHSALNILLRFCFTNMHVIYGKLHLTCRLYLTKFPAEQTTYGTINCWQLTIGKHDKTRWAGQSTTWGRPSLQVRVESRCSYSKFLSQQWQLANNSKSCIAFYCRTTWHMDLHQLTMYEHFRWVNMHAITFFVCGPKFITCLVVRIPPLAPKWGPNTLNFRLNFKFSWSKVFFWGGDPHPHIGVH